MKSRFLIIPALAAVLVAAPLTLLAAKKGEKPAVIAHGSEVALADHLVPGKTTVFDFTSKYCPPCQAIAPMLDKLHADRADVAVVKVDINRPDFKGIDWKSPVARQYAINSVPHFKVYGPDGKLVAEGKEARAMVTSWFK
jgi:thiol-disulfide isomerase/thioredoxin